MLNKAVLMGRLNRDPEKRYTQSNIAVTSFTLAVNRSYNRDETDFINIVAWRNTAEFVSNYFKKGMQVAVSGRIQTRTWDKQDGTKGYATEVVADEVFFAEGRNSSDAGTSNARSFDDVERTMSSNDNVGDDKFESIVDDEELPF